MGTDSTERRRSPRHAVSGVHGSLTFRSDARVVDLSLGGAALETGQHLDVGKAYSIRLGREDGDELRIGGRVVRSRLRGTRSHGNGERGPVYEVAIRFDPMPEERSEALRELLSTSAQIRLEPPAAGRFDLGLPESVRLRRDYQFEVRKVSATGMLIEAGLAPRLDTVFELCATLGDGEIRTFVRVAYVEPIGEGRYHLGVEFRDMSADDRARLDRYIAQAVG